MTMPDLASLLVSGSLLAAGLIHLVPAVGVAGASQLARLYGVAGVAEDPNLLLLLRHRAVLFGVLGTSLTTASFVPPWQPAAVAVGLVSTGSFVLLAALDGRPHNALVRRVVVVDRVIVCCLLTTACALAWK